MEILIQIGSSILSAIGEELVKSASRRIRYLFHSKAIFEDLNEEARKLRSILEDVQHRIDRAKTDTEEIEENVQRWVNDVKEVLANMENTESQSREKQKCLYGWCPNWKRKYQLAKNAEKIKENVQKFVDDGKFEIISHRAPLSTADVITSEEFVPYNSNQRTFDRVMEALKDDKTNLVGLYGMGGVGKTTLAKAVSSKAKDDNMFKKVLMVVVSQNPNIRSIQGQLADFLSLKLEEESEQGRAKRLSMRLKGEKEKILIILDDVWAKLDLKMVGIPVEHCKVFLTTRRKQVCIDMGCQQRIPLEALTKEEGLLLLKRQAGLKDEFPTLNQLAEEVANECKGLPLAIVTVGSALREKSADEWKTMIQKLKKSKLVKLDNVEVEVYAVIKWSYDYLKSDKTKECFLLCSLFPEDHKIDVEELFRYGYGLGWHEDCNSIEETRAELHVMVNNLKASSLLLDVDKGFVTMHDIVRDVALWIASEDNCGFLVKAGLGLTELPNHQDLDQYKAISLIGNDIQVLPDDLIYPKLSIMLLGSHTYYKYAKLKVGDKFFQGMKNLKVLALSNVQLSLSSLESLTGLVTLQLVRCELHSALSLKKLAGLEILSIQDSEYDGYLQELKEINRLRILDLREGSIILEKIHAGVISKLSRLEELYIWSNPNIIGNAALSELNELYCLTTLLLAVNIHGSGLSKNLNLMENIKLQSFKCHSMIRIGQGKAYGEAYADGF